MQGPYLPANRRHCFEHRSLRHFPRKGYMRSKRDRIADKTETLEFAAQPCMQIEQWRGTTAGHSDDHFGFASVLPARA